MIEWKKNGLIFEPRKDFWWMQSHCQLPCVLPVGNDIYRVYFAGRDADQRSHIGYAEFHISDPSSITYFTPEPVLYPGDLGFFDEHGVYPSSVIKKGDDIYLYFIGWNKGAVAPMFYAGIGLAISKDGGKTFRKYSRAPIMARSEHDPCLVTAPNVFTKQDGSLAMIYTSGIKWAREKNGDLRSFYHLKMAESIDGINWERQGTVVIDLKDEEERDISRSTIIKQDGIYKLWFAYNSINTSYRIGYAESRDLKTWDRNDAKAGIDISDQWYENEMICYPHIFNHKDTLYMLYNGNRFGKDGFILARSQ